MPSILLVALFGFLALLGALAWLARSAFRGLQQTGGLGAALGAR